MEGLIGTFVAFVTVILVCGSLHGCPQCNVYSSRLADAAELAHAESAKQVAVPSTNAKLEAADLLAQAEVRRAAGIAQANKIIADSMKGPEGYLRTKYSRIRPTRRAKQSSTCRPKAACRCWKLAAAMETDHG